MSSQLIVQILEWFAVGLLVLIIFVIISAILASLRNVLAIDLLNNVFGVFGVVIKIALDGVQFLRRGASRRSLRGHGRG